MSVSRMVIPFLLTPAGKPRQQAFPPGPGLPGRCRSVGGLRAWNQAWGKIAASVFATAVLPTGTKALPQRGIRAPNVDATAKNLGDAPDSGASPPGLAA